MTTSLIMWTVTERAVRNPTDNLFDRLSENLWRTGITIAVLIIVWGLMRNNISKPLQVIAAVGSTWLSWQIFNSVWQLLATIQDEPARGSRTPVFRGEASPNGLLDLFTGSGLQFFVAIVSVAVAFLVFFTSRLNDDHEKIAKPIRILAALGTWAFLTLAFVIVMNIYAAIQR